MAAWLVDPALVEQATSLPVEQRLELIGALQDSIESASLPVSPETAALIEERMSNVAANPRQGRSWDDVRADLATRRAR